MAERAEPETGRTGGSPAAPPNTPGSRLRARREERALDLKQAAAELRVDAWMLEALEKDDYAAFGAPVFAKGHLRKYAALLGIASEDIMVAYYQLEGARDAPPLVTEAQAARVPPPRSPMLALILIAAAVIALAVVVWLWLSEGSGSDTAGIAAAPAGVQAAAAGTDSARPGTPAMTTERPPARTSDASSGPQSRDGAGTSGETSTSEAQIAALPRGAETPPELTLDGRIESAGQVQQALAQNTSLVVPDTSTSAQPVGGRASGTAQQTGTTLPSTMEVPAAAGSGASVQIQIAFDQESWVEISDANGRRLLYGLGTAGSTERLEGLAPVEVFLGRAPGVRLSVDGQPFVIPEDARRGNVARFRIQPGSRAL